MFKNGLAYLQQCFQLLGGGLRRELREGVLHRVQASRLQRNHPGTNHKKNFFFFDTDDGKISLNTPL